MNQIDKKSIATIRSLCIDMINEANSGHPGMALGSAPILYTLWSKHLIINPKEPNWINRDRFVLSAGHASSLLYALLFLSGYSIKVSDLKKFRKLDSITPGHPEVTVTPGVDATSGPLGQGIAQAVGIAIAEEFLRKKYKKYNLINHFTYVLCGDGCLQEGLSQEAISLAGHQHLNKLILFYDSNNVTLDGPLALSFNENIKERFIASNWNFIEVNDCENIDEINKAIIQAKKSKDKPTVIKVNTIIGYGSVNQGTSKVHGSPLGGADAKHAKKDIYNFDFAEFHVESDVKKHFKNLISNRSKKCYLTYNKNLRRLKAIDNNEYKKYLESITNSFDFDVNDVEFNISESSISTRKANQKILNVFSQKIDYLFGGSADVASSVMTKLDKSSNFSYKNRNGQNMNWGIREFAMASAQNGILLHCGMRSYIGCFFVFADYMKPAIRMAALSRLPAIYLFSHDSVAVGEDGPTHQPIEQLAMLRSIPNINVIRPCDEKETIGAWKCALISKQTPTAIILSRQNLDILKNSDDQKVNFGAYVISKEKKNPMLNLIATGSEVSLAIKVQNELLAKNIDVRVISMPCWELFEKQTSKYKHEILCLDKSKTVSIEMLSTFGWDKYADYHYGIDSFGYSGKANDIINKIGFTVDKICDFCEDIVNKNYSK